MKAEELNSTVDFKKLITIELQLILDKFKGSNEELRLKFATDTAFIEGEINTHEPKDIKQLPPLGYALSKSEENNIVDLKDKDILNVYACIYLKDVKITPLFSPNTPFYLKEFILFTDHILGLSLSE